MGRAETEKRGGGFIYGTREGDPCGKVAGLAQSLWHAGLRHWEIAFLAMDRNLLLSKPGIGPVRLAWLINFKNAVENQMDQSPKLDYHIVEVLPETDPRNLVRRPLAIHGCPVFFPNRQTNWAIERLLRRKRIQSESFIDNLTTLGDLKKDLGFLNRYFNLGLELQETGGKSGEYWLAIPETIKVVESPALFKVPAIPSRN